MSIAAVSDWIDQHWPDGRGWEITLQALMILGVLLLPLAALGALLLVPFGWFMMNFLVATTSRQRM